MIKKTIIFDDFEGKQVSEDHYFHLSMNELLEGSDGELMKKLREMDDPKAKTADILKNFSALIIQGWGERNPDKPTSFVKSPEAQKDFANSLAYDELLGQLILGGGEAVIEFITGMVPKDIMKNPDVQKAMAKANELAASIGSDAEETPHITLLPADEDRLSGLAIPRDAEGKLVPWALRKPTHDEMKKMDQAQLLDAMRRTNDDWIPPAAA